VGRVSVTGICADVFEQSVSKPSSCLIENKLEHLEENTSKNEALFERTQQLEKKMNELTEQRLQFLEQLQQQQHEWQVWRFLWVSLSFLGIFLL